MSNMRLAAIAAALFAAAFGGVYWMSRGFPVPGFRSAQVSPAKRVPNFKQAYQDAVKREWHNSKTSQGDGDRERETLRLEAMQAANAYSLSPCDKTIKANFVAALTAYAKAWSDKSGCKFMVCSGDTNRVEGAAKAFSSPADARVREAVMLAFEKGGVSIEDFPFSLRIWIAMIAHDRGDPVSACATAASSEKPQSFQAVKRLINESASKRSR